MPIEKVRTYGCFFFAVDPILQDWIEHQPERVSEIGVALGESPNWGLLKFSPIISRAKMK